MFHPAAKWVGTDRVDVPVIRRRFCVNTTENATLTITGLGYFEARINGTPVTDAWFLPFVTDYEPRDLSKLQYPLFDKTTHRVYYHTFDVAALLCEGENELTIALAPGFYRQHEKQEEGECSFGECLKTIYTLTAGDCTVFSDGSEIWQESEIRYANLFYGEVIDPAAVTGEQYPVEIANAPETTLCPAIGTPDRVIRTVIPKKLHTADERTVWDVGENISGVVRVTTHASAGERITLRFAENLSPEGKLDFHTTGGHCTSANGKPQIMEDTFVADGTDRVFAPTFVWHAFRYFDVAGEIDTAEVLVIHSDTPVTATFEVPHEGLTFFRDAFLRAQLNNMHGSLPSDCPHRERLGYTGDGQVCAPAAMLSLDAKAFYEKWIIDILDCQDTVGGHVQHTAPLMGGGGGPGGWGCAIVLVPWAYYRQYGDIAMLHRCFEPMCRWMDYLDTRMENGLITREEEGGWCLGDWAVQPLPPAAYVNTCYYIQCMRLLEKIAPLVGQAEKAADFAARRAVAEEAVRREFTVDDEFPVEYGGGVFAVWCGLAGRELADKTAAYYDALGHFDTGFLTTDLLFEVLFEYDHADTVLSLLTSEEAGSYLYQKRRGGTALWEHWTGGYSHDHPMYGGGVRTLFTHLLGMKQHPDAAGWTHVIIDPKVPQDLPWAKGSIETPLGTLAVAWEQTEYGLNLTVDAPEGMLVEGV
ncbi:MAG: hypothetical protein E7552_05645 [Ruminococcaceae bacterium]|nr:hypothetical protein [Oscillospiraceae bacterium]